MKREFEHFDVRVSDHRRLEERSFRAGQHFRLDHHSISRYLRVPLTNRMVDLLRIASTVYFVDRAVRRDRSGRGDGWARRITSSIEVQDIGFWKRSETKELLEHTVGFLSGDHWSFEFSAGAAVHNPCCQRLKLGDTPPLVCLYSGGLDSAAGLAYRLSMGIDRPIMPVVVRHRTDIAKTAIKQLSLLESHFGVTLFPVTAMMSTVRPRRLGAEESSQRARSFLFLSVGGVVAWATDSDGVELYESGIGAINVPLLAGMEGSQATRSCHPAFLRNMAALLTLAAERQIDVRLPFMELTKGEIVQQGLRLTGLQSLASATVSCVNYPLRHMRNRGWRTCGVCPACIFRRLALHAGGINESPENYDIDLLSPLSDHMGAKKQRYLKAFLLLVDQLTDLEDGLPIVLARHLRETDVLGSGMSLESCLSLYRRYRGEWLAFLERAKSNGCRWSNLIDLPVKAA
jgi:7-cyano-7-deazaguanine synthase in queuosine biosynthesis